MTASWKWKAWYDTAFVEIEVEDGKRQERLEAAKHAIVDRLEDSLQGREPLNSAERVQIEEACRNLLLLRKVDSLSKPRSL
jgi:hypothetical protein